MTLTVETSWEANGNPKSLEFGMPYIQSGDEDEIDDVIAMAETIANAAANHYSCRMRRWGKRVWKVWEPGEGGFEMWIRACYREDDE